MEALFGEESSFPAAGSSFMPQVPAAPTTQPQVPVVGVVSGLVPGSSALPPPGAPLPAPGGQLPAPGGALPPPGGRLPGPTGATSSGRTLTGTWQRFADTNQQCSTSECTAWQRFADTNQQQRKRRLIFFTSCTRRTTCRYYSTRGVLATWRCTTPVTTSSSTVHATATWYAA
ncbi:unnamed protein product [Amoebophrya sp. A25]|nr:unnamed protein product [Amoebophrya sp. A25]|eukprot:GSA25T00022372001.1